MTSYAPHDWRGAGACVSADPDLFFPISPEGKGAGQIARALRICGGCGVRRECLEFALRTREAEGIWGGTTPEERARTRRDDAARRHRERLPEPAASVA
jgi:WhiB family transcriptional regulator, redox-sensing transcriptional regulator